MISIPASRASIGPWTLPTGTWTLEIELATRFRWSRLLLAPCEFYLSPTSRDLLAYKLHH